MGSSFGDWPSYNPHNFSHFRPSDPSNPSVSCSYTRLSVPALVYIHCSIAVDGFWVYLLYLLCEFSSFLWGSVTG